MSRARQFAGFGAESSYYGPGSPDYDYQSQASRNADNIGKGYIDPAMYLAPPAQPAGGSSISFNPSEITFDPAPPASYGPGVPITAEEWARMDRSAPTLYDQAFGPAAPGKPPLMLFAGLGILAVGLYLVLK